MSELQLQWKHQPFKINWNSIPAALFHDLVMNARLIVVVSNKEIVGLLTVHNHAPSVLHFGVFCLKFESTIFAHEIKYVAEYNLLI